MKRQTIFIIIIVIIILAALYFLFLKDLIDKARNKEDKEETPETVATTETEGTTKPVPKPKFPDNPPPPFTGIVTASVLRVRGEANIKGAIRTKLNRGATVKVTDKIGNWYKISIPSVRGKTYVYAAYIKRI